MLEYFLDTLHASRNKHMKSKSKFIPIAITDTACSKSAKTQEVIRKARPLLAAKEDKKKKKKMVTVIILKALV